MANSEYQKLKEKLANRHSTNEAVYSGTIRTELATALQQYRANSENKKAQKEMERKAQALWKDLTTPIYTSVVDLKPNAELHFKPIWTEGIPGTKPKDATVLDRQSYDAIMSYRNALSSENEIKNLKSEKERAKSEYEKAEDFNVVVKFLEMGNDTKSDKDIAKDKYASSMETYYQKKYGTDADLNTILNSLKLQAKETADAKERKELEDDTKEISSLLYGRTAIDDYIKSSVDAGMGSYSAGVTATLDATVGKALELFGFEDNFINQFNDTMQAEYKATLERQQNAAIASGDTNNIFGTLTSAVVSFVPDMLLMYMTKKPSASGTLNTLSRLGVKTTAAKVAQEAISFDKKVSPLMSISKLGTSIGNAATTTLKTAAKNPLYWTSFARTFGTDVQEAKEKGASESVAYLYGLVTSSMNALVEVSGGVQVLPERLKNMSKSQILQWITSAIEEGGEEVVQSLISEMNEKLMYDFDKEVFSFTNDDAVFNPVKAGKEFAIGTAVGSLIGGGQTIVNNVQSRDYIKLGKAVRNTVNIQDLLDYASSSSDEYIRSIVTEKNADNLSARDLGVIYNYAVRDIDAAFNSVSDVEGVNRVLGELINEKLPESVNMIAFSRWVNRLDAIDPQTVSGYNENNSVSYQNNNGGNVNGSTNTELLERGEVSTVGRSGDTLRQQGENSQAVRGTLGNVSEAEGHNDIRSEGGGSAWLSGGNLQSSQKMGGGLTEGFLRALREKRPSGVDTKGRPVSEQTLKRLADTVFKAEDGSIIVLYHWTPNLFEEFKYGDGAFHLGTLSASLSIKAKSEAGGEGFLKECYVVSKRPFVVKDNGGFGACNITRQMVDLDLIDNATYQKIKQMEGFYSDRYDAEANVFVRQYLKDLGFDSYLYQNGNEDTGTWSVGVFDADQIITVAENGVLKEGSGVSEDVADSVSSEDTGADTQVDDTGAAPTGKRVLDMPAITVKQQNYIKGIAKRLGRTVEFVNMEKFLKRHDIDTSKLKIYPDGAIDGEGNIYIWYNAKKPVQFLFKHELTHFGERSKLYKTFVNAIRKTSAYKAWLETAVRETAGWKEWRKTRPLNPHLDIDGMEKFLRQDRMTAREGLKEVRPGEAQAEIIADFVGEKCFGENLEDLEKLVNSVENVKERNAVVQFLHDFFNNIKQKMQGVSKLDRETGRIEELFARMIADANKTKTPDTQDRELKYSIVAPFTDNEGNQYYNAVLLDTDFFDGLSPRNWGSKLKEYVYNRSENNPFIMTVVDENGKSQNIEFAKKSDRVSKNNGKDHKVLSELIRTDDNISKLSAIHIDEIIEVSEENNPYYTSENSHGWLDQNGWLHRNANVINARNGNIYNVTVDIAKTADGRTVLYATKGKIKKVGQTKVNSLKIRGSTSHSNFNDSITDEQSTVKNNSMQESENYSSEKNDLKFSVPTATESDTDTDTATDFAVLRKELLDKYKNGEITEQEFSDQMDALWERAISENGQIKQGEMAAPQNKPVAVPKSVKDGTKVREFVRTVLESGYATPEMETFLKSMILRGEFSFEPTSDKARLKQAEDSINEKGYQKALDKWQKQIHNILADDENLAVEGEVLLKLALEHKSPVDVLNIAADFAEFGTRTGRNLQAVKLLKKMGGMAQLVYVERCVAKINMDLEKRFARKKKKGKAAKKDIPVVKIDPILAEQLAQSKTEADYEVAYEAIMRDIAAQVPSTFLDKLNAWRYMAMLVNPTTHAGNFFGSAIFAPMVRIKNILGAVMELSVSKEKRTKSVVVKKKYKDFAEKDFEDIKELLTGSGKYNPSDAVQNYRTIFKSKFLEAVRRFNFDALEWEDAIFLKAHYKHALGGYLQAQGIELDNISREQMVKAREYAIQEALKATFRDASKVANILSELSRSNKIMNIGIEGTLPFKKTPINIAKRGVEYNPMGLITTLGKGIRQLHRGELNATEFIDGLASSFTGTGVFVLGMLLASLGVAKGGFDDEEKWFRQLNGEQEYSIEIGGKSYTISWMAPACIPFFMGVALAEYKPDEDGDFLSNIGGFLAQGFEPLLELSCLSGVEDLISGVKYTTSGNSVYAVAGNAAGSYLSQLIPTMGGKFANLFDDTRRTKYIDKTSDVPEVVQEALDKIASKTPFASQTRAEYIDAWGNTQYTGNFLERFVQQFVSRAYISTVNVSDMSDELLRLRRETGVSGIFPSTPKKYLTIKGSRKDLSREDYFNYATFKGQTQFDLVDEAIHSEKYAKLTDEQKAAVIKDIYSYAGALAKCQLEYSYEEVAAMEGGTDVLTEERWKKLNSKARQMLIEDWCMEGNKTAYKQAQNGGSVVEYFCKKAKE